MKEIDYIFMRKLIILTSGMSIFRADGEVYNQTSQNNNFRINVHVVLSPKRDESEFFCKLLRENKFSHHIIINVVKLSSTFLRPY